MRDDGLTEFKVRYQQTQTCEITVEATDAADAARQVTDDALHVDADAHGNFWVAEETLVDWDRPVIESITELNDDV